MPRLVRVLALFLVALTAVAAPTPGADGRSLQSAMGAVAPGAQPTVGEPVAFPQAVRFEANRGQARADVRYVARGSGRAMVFDDDGLAMRYGENIVRIGFAGTEAQPVAELTERLPGVSHYMLGVDRDAWVRGVAGYRSLVYRGVWPGVDAHFYGHGTELEFDFVIAPGADPAGVVLQFEGADTVQIDADGRLLVGTGDDHLVLRAPVSYQPSAGAAEDELARNARVHDRTPVASSYRLLGDARVGFDVGSYDASRPLVIDPVLVYSTYLGGAAAEFGQGIAGDAAGNAYLVGRTESTTFPTTPGAYQAACAGASCADGFITKLDPSGALVFSTFIGGSGSDGLVAVEVSTTTGDIHFVGGTSSIDFPVSAGAFQSSLAGGGDAVVGTLDASGSTLISATYFGGSTGGEGPTDIAIDEVGNAYITGQGLTCDLPTTPGAFQTAVPFCGLFNAFVAKFNPSATVAFYVTYLGANDGSDSGNGIDVDSDGNAYVVGFAGSMNFPTTPGSFQPANAGGSCLCVDAFVTKFLPDGSGLVYSTYLGGTGTDGANDIVVDAAGNAYVVGSTDSTDFPTMAPWQAALAGGSDAFVAVLDPAGSALVSSSYLGGTGGDGANGLALVGPGDLWLTGSTTSTDFPVVDAVQAVSGGGRDGFVARFDTATPALTMSTYLGGIGDDFARDIDLAGTGAVGIGFTDSIDLPTVNPLQAAFGGGRDAFAFKIGAGSLEVSIAAPGTINPRNRGVIPVAIITTPSFDATTVDPATARFGPAAAPIVHRTGHIGDLDGDGDTDLQLHFRTPATGIACGDTEATLTAETFDGTMITATTPIRTVGCG